MWFSVCKSNRTSRGNTSNPYQYEVFELLEVIPSGTSTPSEREPSSSTGP